jgi:hypothetical protein
MKMPYQKPSLRPVPKFNGTKHAGTFAKAKRRGVPADIAARVFDRDGRKCVGCAEDRRERLTIDHILPVKLGGDNLMGNLQTLCTGCNFDKKDGLTAAAMRKLHPELRLDDLEYTRAFGTGRGDATKVRWGDTVHTVRIVADVRSVLVPAAHYDAVLSLLAQLRDQ